MSFDIFENIYTASDPAGGRAIKVSTTAGIDNADSYYTVSDPAGGRALKVKIITGGGGGSNGTLQVAGGVALSSTLRSITDSVGNFSPIHLSTGSLELRTTATTGTYLFTIDGGGFSSYAKINSGDEQSSVLEFTTGSSALNIGDIRANSTNGIALTSGVAFPIKFYTNGDYVNTAAEFDTVGTLNTYYSITLNDLNSTGNSKITFNYNGTNTQIGLISATEGNFEVSSKNGRPLWLSTGGSAGAVIIDDDGTVNIGTHLSINGNSGNGYIHLTTQASSPAGVVNKISLWSDSSNRLSWRQGTGFSVTLDNSNLTASRIYKFPNADTFIAGLNLAQTFTAAQTISANGALSAPGFTATGTWIATGGTSTTTKPYILIETTGATSANWSTAGTGLAVNAASGFTGNLLDLQTNGAAELKVAYNGNITGTGTLNLTTNGALSTPVVLFNGTWISGGTSATTTPQVLIQPSTASSPSWNTGGTGLGINSASGFAGNLIAVYSNGAATFRVQTDSSTLIGGGNVRIQAVTATGTGQSPIISGTGLSVYPASLTVGHGLLVYTPAITSQVSGDSGALKLTTSFTPAAGGASFQPINIAYTINASGAQTGTVTGIYARATETLLNGATHNLIDLGTGTTSIFSVSNVGVPNFNQTLANSAGGSSGQHLNIKVGATSYKIALLLP